MRAILAQGEAIVPYLVEEIGDTTRTDVFYFFRYTRGDLALALLDEICTPTSWPFPDGSRGLPREGNVYDYVEFIEVQANREAIQRSWESFARRGGCRRDAGP